MAEYSIFQAYFDPNIFIERGEDILNDKNKIDEFGAQIPSKFFQKIPLEEKIDHCFLNGLKYSQILFKLGEEYLFRNDYLAILIFFNCDFSKKLNLCSISGKKIRKHLTKFGNINTYKSYNSEILSAIQKNDLNEIQKLINEMLTDVGRIPNFLSGINYVSTSIINNNYELANFFIEKGFYHNGDLKKLCTSGHLEGVKFLLETGKFKFDNDIIFEVKNVEILELLIEYGADINVYNRIFLTKNCENGNIEIIKYLVNRGFSLNCNDLRCILKFKNLEIMDFFIRNGMNYEINKKCINSVLFEVCSCASFSEIDFLLSVYNFDFEYVGDLMNALNRSNKKEFIKHKIIQIFLKHNFNFKITYPQRVENLKNDFNSFNLFQIDSHVNFGL